MAAHNSLGKKGEALAESWLQSQQFAVLHRNWRYGRYEIDFIAEKDGMLHFVEVKMRSSRRYGFPEEAVTAKKFRHLLEAADEFLYHHPQYRHVQYDVLAISAARGADIEYFFIEDVYL